MNLTRIKVLFGPIDKGVETNPRNKIIPGAGPGMLLSGIKFRMTTSYGQTDFGYAFSHAPGAPAVRHTR